LADQKLSSDSLEKSIKFCSPAGDFSTLFIAILVSIFPNNESKLPDYTTVNSNFCFDVALKSTDQHGNGAVPGRYAHPSLVFLSDSIVGLYYPTDIILYSLMPGFKRREDER
jgi:hypothetical protein